MQTEDGLILPDGMSGWRTPEHADRVVIDNRTGLPDELVQEAVATHFVENASMLGSASSFQTFQGDGSLLARSKFKPPANLVEEIRLARDMAERDDDVGAAIGIMSAIAFGDGMENFHEDDRTTQVFNGVAREANLDGAFKEMYREFLIAGSVTTASLFTRTTLDLTLAAERNEELSVASPLIGVLPAELIRPIGNDLFGDAELAYVPDNNKLKEWLDEFFNPKTTAARKAEMRRQDRVSAALFVEKVKVSNDDDLIGSEIDAYKLNPRMCHRTSMPKGAWPHARPLLTRNFGLLEAKRLLNIMDYALLQGGSNFIVVAKKGDKDRPAMPEEVANLHDVVRRASRTGVIIGDHRLSFEILTPDLTELLNPEKRRMIGRKLARALLRLPESEEGAGEGVKADVEFMARVIGSDRRDLKRHVERNIYAEVIKRNKAELDKGSPKLWFPKIVLAGTNYFTDYVLKLRDRGDIPRKFAVEAGGFDWEAGVAQRKRELDADIDETMAPAAVPFSSPEAGPQDNNEGRPQGTSPNNGAPGAQQGPGRDNVRPLRTINRSAGETVKAIHDEEHGVVRVGVQTYAILEQYPDHEVGRVTALERRALDAHQPTTEGPIAVIPVNPAYEVAEVRAVRLAAGLSILVGNRRGDQALVAKALCFRSPEFDPLDAEETALRWGFPIEGWEAAAEVLEERAREQLPAPGEQHIHLSAGAVRTKKVVRRDEHGNITEIEDVPVEDE